MSTGFTPKKPQQRTTLFRDSTKPLVSSTRVLSRNDPHVAGQRLAIHEPAWVAQEYFGRQCRDRPYSRMRHIRATGIRIGECLGFGGDCAAVAGVATLPSRMVGPKHARRGSVPRFAGVRDRREPSARYAACPRERARPSGLALAAACSAETDRGIRRCGSQWRE